MAGEVFSAILARLRAIALRRRLERDLEEELAFHLAERAHKIDPEHPDEAARQARVRLGNPTLWKETLRDMWTFNWFEVFRNDLRYAFRTLLKTPVFTAAA